MQYWPNASRWVAAGEPVRLWTVGCSDSMKEALKVILHWRDEYRYILLEAWVDVFKDGKKVKTIRYTMNEIKRLRA